MKGSSLFACAFSATLKTSPPSPLRAEPIQLRPDDSANDALCNLLNNDETRTQVILEGLVTKRRAIGRHLVFLDVLPLDLPNVHEHNAKKVDDDIDLIEMTPIQAIMRRDVWNDTDSNKNCTTPSYDVYHKIIQPGVHVALTGYAGPSRIANEAVLFSQSARYLLGNDNPQHLRNVLRFAKDGELSINEVIDALPCIGREELSNMLGLLGNDQVNNTFGELAVEILSRFPRNFLRNPSQMMGSTNAQKVRLLQPAPTEYVNVPSFCLDHDDAVEEDTVSSIADVLREKQRMQPNTYKQFTLSGWVQNRRRYQGRISVLELVDQFLSLASVSFEENGSLDDDGGKDSDSTTSDFLSTHMKARNSKLNGLWKERIYAVLHPDGLQMSNDDSDGITAMSNIELSEIFGNVLSSGARVSLVGYLHSDSATFWVTNCRLLRSSWRPSTVRLILDLLHQQKLGVEEAAKALELPGGYSQADDIAKGATSVTERQWMAAEITQSLQSENSRVGSITNSMKQALNYFAYARDHYPIEKNDSASELDKTTARERATSLLSNGGPLRASPEGSRWQRAKKPQLKFMIDEISQVLRSHPEYGERKLKILDIGGGKGMLSNLLAETFGEGFVEVQVVDISRSATNNGMMRARRRGLQNVQYDAVDASVLDCSAGVDVVVALHACGVLTDVALGHAACQGAGFVICPCCFRSNPHLRVSIPANKTSPAQLVSAEEWLNVDFSAYGHLKQLAELQGDINISSKAAHSICGLRAMAVGRLWRNSRWPAAELHSSIKTFPIGFSTRNTVLLGKFNNKNR